MGPEDPPTFDYAGDPYLIKDEDPYLAKQETLDPDAPEVPKFRLLSLSGIRNLPDPEWLVQRFLQTDSFAVLFGAPGSTKSFFALDLALSIATGLEFHGGDVRKGQVVYAAGEGLRGLKWRVESWLLAHPEANEADVERNLHIIPDVPHLLDNLHTTKLLNTAEAVAEAGEPLRLVIVDTWARAMVGGDENSQKDSGLAIHACERIRKSTSATILVVHHTGTEGTRERGSTALRGAADTSIMTTHEELTRYTTVTVKKMKDGEAGHQSTFALKPFAHSVVLQSVKPTLSDNAAAPTVRDRDYYARKAVEKKEGPF
jgi:RecA-family ATPase